MASAGQVKSVAAIAARCTIEVGDKVAELAQVIKVAEQRVGGGVAELVTQLDAVRRDANESSRITSEQTHALVRWTKVLAFVTGAYALMRGGMLLVTWLVR